MQATCEAPKTIWLRTNWPVVPLNLSLCKHLDAVEDALYLGVAGFPDPKRPGFFHLRSGGKSYYIHMPTAITGVYLIGVF
jgi:hypothetical protein